VNYRVSVLVSIACITYNHEKYIAQAIEGFLMQKTDFNFEVLIHDDASTDRTAAIIKEYESKYPEIIKPIYQTENQYSRGIKINATYNYPRAQGQYIALCDGDDYWTDALKLQKQTDYMVAHSACSMCFHAIKMVNNDRTPMGKLTKPFNATCSVPTKYFIRGGGGIFSSSSVFFPKKCMDNPPEFYLISPINDVPLALNLAIQGTVYYIDEVMAAYRQQVEGSWTNRMAASQEYLIEHETKMIKMRNEFNRYTENRFADCIESLQIQSEALILMAEGKFRALKSERYQSYCKQVGRYQIAKRYLHTYYPRTHNILRHYGIYMLTKIARMRARNKAPS